MPLKFTTSYTFFCDFNTHLFVQRLKDTPKDTPIMTYCTVSECGYLFQCSNLVLVYTDLPCVRVESDA
jgi:hypothetical protein